MIPDFSAWPKYLSHPLVLIGFTLMLLAVFLFALLKNGIIRSSKYVIAFFSLGIMVVLLGFGYVFYEVKSDSSAIMGPDNIAAVTGITQKIIGNQSPAVIANGDVNIHYR